MHSSLAQFSQHTSLCCTIISNISLTRVHHHYFLDFVNERGYFLSDRHTEQQKRQTDREIEKIYIYKGKGRMKTGEKMKMIVAILAALAYGIYAFVSSIHAADSLFVQTASGATRNDGTLTLMGVRDKTTYFADRPVRVAGCMSTEDFMTLFEPSRSFSEVRTCPFTRMA